MTNNDFEGSCLKSLVVFAIGLPLAFAFIMAYAYFTQ